MYKYFILDSFEAWCTLVMMFATFYFLMPHKKFTIPAGLLLSAADASAYYLIRYSDMQIFISLRKTDEQMLLLSSVYLLSVFLFVFLGFSCGIKRKLKVSFTMILTDVVLEGLISLIVTFILKLDPGTVKNNPDNYNVISFFTVLLTYFAACSLTYIICRERKPEYSEKIIFPVFSLALCFILLFSFMANIYHIYWQNKFFLLTFSLVFVFIIMFAVSIHMLIKYSIEAEREKNEIDRIKEIQNFAVEKIEQSRRNDEKMRRIKHDYLDQLMCIKMLIEKNTDESLEKADALIASVGGELESVKTEVFSDNLMVSVILSAKISEAAEKNIKIVPEICVRETFSAGQGRDIGLIMMNLLNNAIEACERNSDAQGKEIRYSMKEKGGFLIIRTENSCEKQPLKENGKFVTGKKDRENHGIGSRIIKSIADKYKGRDDIFAGDGRFIHSVSIELL